MLRVLENGMIGQFNRDDTRCGRTVPGPWCWPPIYATVTAGARCLLALLELKVRMRGGMILYRDTDGAIVAAAASACWHPTPTGRGVRVIARADLDAILTEFDALDPFSDGGPFWAVKASGISVTFGPKKYGMVDEAGRRVAGTAHVIGAYLPPPGAATDWDEEVAATHVRRLLKPDEPLSFAWDREDDYGFPALESYAPSTLAALDELPRGLGAHPFARIVHASADPLGAGPAPRHRLVALDPGGDRRDWKEWAWYGGDKRRDVTTDLSEAIDTGADLLETLLAKAAIWGNAATTTASPSATRPTAPLATGGYQSVRAVPRNG
jgi:hypothetical protein